MCLHCKTPSQDELLDLDSFDLAFLTLTGHVEWLDPLDTTYMALKALESHGSKEYLWGPEADLLSKAIRSAWRKHGLPQLKEVQDAFDFSPKAPDEIKVDMEAVSKFIRDTRNTGKKMWLQVGKKARSVMATAAERSLAHFRRQQAREPKRPKQWAGRVRKQVDPEGWAEFIAAAEADHLAEFMQQYPNAILHQDVRRLAGLAQDKEALRIIDKAQIQERLRALPARSERYWDNLSDVQAGRVWTQTGIEYAYQQGVTEYMVVSERDKATCPTCRRIDGRTFSVSAARERIVEALNAESTADIAAAQPFPRVGDLDNRPPEEIRGMALAPPFHGRCRCDVIMLWKDTSTSTARSRGFPPPKEKPKPRKVKPVPKPPVPRTAPKIRTLASILQHSEVNAAGEWERIGGGVNQTFKVTFKDRRGRTIVQGAWKPLKGENFDMRRSITNKKSRLMHREAASSDLAQQLELQYAQHPETYVRTIAGEEGSVQFWVDDTVEAYKYTGRELTAHETYEMGVFNLLIGNTDRHGRNYLRLRKQGRAVLIDHGYSFPRASSTDPLGLGEFRAGYLRRERLRSVADRHIDSEFKKDLVKKLKKIKLRDVAKTYNLNASELSSLRARRDTLVKLIEEDQFIAKVKSQGPKSIGRPPRGF